MDESRTPYGDIHQALKSIFPNGINEPDYYLVIRLLYPYVAQKNLANIMTELSGRPWAITYNDVLGTESDPRKEPEREEEIYRQFVEVGLQELLEKDD